MKRTITLLLMGVLIATLFTACGSSKEKPLRIAISKASPNYVNWLKRADSTIVTVNLFPMSVDSALTALESCSGLLLSGGEDVYPGIYGAGYDTGDLGWTLEQMGFPPPPDEEEQDEEEDRPDLP